MRTNIEHYLLLMNVIIIILILRSFIDEHFSHTRTVE